MTKKDEITIEGKRWRVKSRQRFGLIIECATNKNDIRRISFEGWEKLKNEN